MNIGYPAGSGPCVKQVVTAKLISESGDVFIGKNYCCNPQERCPRDAAGMKSGEGYHLCKEICRQEGHAEENAIKSAGAKAERSVIYLSGHTYACDNCKAQAKAAGVRSIVIGGGE